MSKKMDVPVLQRPVLVLNKGWQPIDTVNVERALKMCVGEWIDEHGKMHPKSQIINTKTWTIHDWSNLDGKSQNIPWEELPIEDGDIVVRSGRRSYLAPEIIVAVRYNKIPKSQLNFNKNNLFKRDKNTCQYCGCQPGLASLSTDHILPRSRGGKSDWDNCCVSCYTCNQKKRDRTPEEANMPRPKVGRPGFEIITESFMRMESWERFLGKIS
jgi:5-methylcytosine-specific restriction endonuclease McrA